MSLQVTMDEKTKNWLTTKKALTISPLELNGCCVPNAEVQTTYTVPKFKQRYEHIENQCIPIYIDKRLDFKQNKVILQLKGFRPFLTLQVEGLVRF